MNKFHNHDLLLQSVKSSTFAFRYYLIDQNYRNIINKFAILLKILVSTHFFQLPYQSPCDMYSLALALIIRT